jgi:hypothetical protein
MLTIHDYNNLDQSLINLLDTQASVTYKINDTIEIEYPSIHIKKCKLSFGLEKRKVRWCNKISLLMDDLMYFSINIDKEIYNCDTKYNISNIYDSLISGSINMYGDTIETFTYIENTENDGDGDLILDNLRIDVLDLGCSFEIRFSIPIFRNICNIYGFDYSVKINGTIIKNIYNKTNCEEKCNKIPINYSSSLEFVRLHHD